MTRRKRQIQNLAENLRQAGDLDNIAHFEPRRETVGDLLRRARVGKSQEIAEVATRLRIRPGYLKAIEDSRFQDLPGLTYAVGFVRTYADHLGLDSEDVVRRFRDEVTELKSQTQLIFPVVAAEGKIPRGAVLLLSAVLAAIAYGGWYYLSEREQSPLDLIPALPERLQQLISGDDAVPDPGPEAVPGATGAATTGDAAPGQAATVSPAPAVTAPAAPATTPAPVTTAAPAPAAPAATTSETAAPQAAAPAVDPAAPTAAAPAPGSTSVVPGATTAPVDGQPAAVPPAASETTQPAPVVQAPATDPAAPAPGAVAAADTAPAVAAPGAPAVAAPGLDSSGLPTVAAPATPAIPGVAAPADTASLPPVAEGQVFGATEGAPSRIVLVARLESWIQVTDPETNALLTRVLRAGDRYYVPDQPGLTLATGNAGGLDIWVDGGKVPTLGPVGVVRRGIMLDPARLQTGTALSE